MIRQLMDRVASTGGVIDEVKAVYNGIRMCEEKSIELQDWLTSTEGLQVQPKNEQWEAYFKVHDELIKGHCDLLLLSQYPSASPELRRLPSDYDMPARMWRHGIYSMLETTRHRLPSSLEHMIRFCIYAFRSLTLLHQFVAPWKTLWTEYIRDLVRYRLDIREEDDDIQDRETWMGVSQVWCSEAEDLASLQN
ncbi:hypothetical protein HDV57DRAFT_488159 [Trichoderma longibrachiatum]